MLKYRRMEITYGGNKMSVKICELTVSEYLQKLIFTEIMLKVCNNIYTA